MIRRWERIKSVISIIKEQEIYTFKLMRQLCVWQYYIRVRKGRWICVILFKQQIGYK